MTHVFSHFGPVLSGAMFAAALLSAPAAFAQTAQNAPGTSNGMLTGPVVQPVPDKAPAAAPPPALPGARSGGDVTPLDRPPSDMGPNEALFDAINRGDVGAARESLSRGADLHATNLLGMTPTELAIDLGRSDLIFLLLSMRDSSGGGAPSAKEARKPVPPAPATARSAPPRPAPRPAPVVAATRPAPAPMPQKYADVPAAPVPQAGFLGFGGTAR